MQPLFQEGRTGTVLAAQALDAEPDGVFAARADHLQLRQVIGSGGTFPGSNRALGLEPSATPQFTSTPGQVAFSPDGSQLIVARLPSRPLSAARALSLADVMIVDAAAGLAGEMDSGPAAFMTAQESPTGGHDEGITDH